MAKSKDLSNVTNTMFRQFLKRLKLQAKEGHSAEPAPLTFYHPNFGGLALDAEEASEYRNAVARIHASCGDPPAWSKREVENRFQRAVLAACDFVKLQPSTSEKNRTKKALHELVTTLTAKPVDWVVAVPLTGLSNDCLPRSLGLVRFQRGSKAALRRRMSGQHAPALWEISIKDNLPEEFALATTTVLANDAEAAQTLAMARIQLAVDVLNFFSDIQHPSAWNVRVVTVDNDIPKPGVSLAVSSEGTQQTFLRTAPGRVALEMPVIGSKRGRQLLLHRVHALLKKVPKNEVDERILNALRWAGRATVSRGREHRFLLYAIALESLILPASAKEGITAALAKRVAHLLFLPEYRQENVARIKKLYDVRSQIAHNGKVDVTDIDLGGIRWVAKESVLAVLREPLLRNAVTCRDFDDWFEQRLLGVRAS